MKLQHRAAALTAAAVLALSTLTAPVTAFAASEDAAAENGILDLLPAPLRDLIDPENAPLRIAEQGIFSAGGTVIRSDGTFDVGNYYTSREGSTSMWTTPTSSTRSPKTTPNCPWYSCTGTASPAWLDDYPGRT